MRDYALSTLTKQEENVWSIYSSNSFGGSELVKIPVSLDGVFKDHNGNILDAQKTEDGYYVQVDVEQFGAVNVKFEPADESTVDDGANKNFEKVSVFQVSDNCLSTPFYNISWNENGQLTQVYDKEEMRQVLRTGQLGNVLEIYEDKPLNYDAWDIDNFHIQKMQTASLVKGPEIIDSGDLACVLRFTYQYHLSTIVQDMIVYRDSKRIDFKTKYTDIRSVKATYDIQFGHAERPTHWNNSWDWAKFEVCGHKWADLSENGYGVSLLNNCKYGHSIKDNVMRLSLLKSAVFPDTTADKGEHEFIYSLLPHKGSFIEGRTIEEANQLNQPAQVVNGRFKD